jgi:diadenosine tetraphosphate (Ap4A) HIT family hydrolase
MGSSSHTQSAKPQTPSFRLLSNRLRHDDPTIEGFNVGENLGEVAGQTVARAHIHLIPRRRGDSPDPTGGVRGVIPGQARYT